MKHTLYLLLLCLSFSAQAQHHQVRREGKILAHGLRFDPEVVTTDMPMALQELLRAYRTQPRYAERQQGRAVPPLLRSIRHQEEPFNRSCPYYTDNKGKTSEERCIVGCVATCLEQVLSYYRYPEMLLDTLYGWETEHYQIPDVAPGARIDWAHILDDYRNGYTDTQAQAVSDLSYYCGMAVQMNWGLSSSGANLYRAYEPLQRVFGYKTVHFLSRAMYSSPRWNALLRNELENGRPICYTGHNMALSGHAFNIDGVDEEGYYHLNWGYGGDYDGYFDLDYLTPFEYVGNETELGRNEGFFSNQTALFMYPGEVAIDVSDSLTLEDAFAGVVVDNISFRRQPDTQGYVIADFSMTNQTQDSLNFTFEVLTYLPTDTAIFYQADYVGLSAVNLAPGESRTWPVYCHFTETGERILSFSADDETLPYKMGINVTKGTSPRLVFGEVDYRMVKDGDNLTGEFSLEVTNQAESGWAGNLVTYCLLPEDETADLRHWEVLSIPAGATQPIGTAFQHLEDGRTYIFRVRCPWTVQQEYTFTVKADDATDCMPGRMPERETNSLGEAYNLAGSRAAKSDCGQKFPDKVVIRQGKKYLTTFPYR